MELELHELELHAIFFFFFFLSLIGQNFILNQASFSLKLDFLKIEFQNKGTDLLKIEFQNKGTDLYSFKTWTYCQIFLKIGVKG